MNLSRFKTLTSKALLNLQLDGRVLKLDYFTLMERFKYIFIKYHAILSNKRQMPFMGRRFVYDNRLQPAMLFSHVEEVRDLARFVDLNKCSDVLDLGANVGQFGYVVSLMFPHIRVVSFEPNPEVFDILKSNASAFSKWRCFNMGIAASDKQLPFYFVPGKSGQGSVFKENATNSPDTFIQELFLQFSPINDHFISKNNIPKVFDLVKIDVEGYEMDVMKGIESLSWRFLYVEISERRAGAASIEVVVEHIRKIWRKDVQVLYDRKHKGSFEHELLLSAEPKKLT